MLAVQVRLTRVGPLAACAMSPTGAPGAVLSGGGGPAAVVNDQLTAEASRLPARSVIAVLNAAV